MKLLKNIFGFILATLFFLVLASYSPVLADCPSTCNGATSYTSKQIICSWSTCRECDWCSPYITQEGIQNPVVGKFGTGAGATIIAELIANALKITFSLAGLVLLGMLIWGGFEWMTSAGNQESLVKAQQKITNALIGFVIFMAVFAVINYLAPLFGFDFLNILKIEWPTP